MCCAGLYDMVFEERTRCYCDLWRAGSNCWPWSVKKKPPSIERGVQNPNMVYLGFGQKSTVNARALLCCGSNAYQLWHEISVKFKLPSSADVNRSFDINLMLLVNMKPRIPFVKPTRSILISSRSRTTPVTQRNACSCWPGKPTHPTDKAMNNRIKSLF